MRSFTSRFRRVSRHLGPDSFVGMDKATPRVVCLCFSEGAYAMARFFVFALLLTMAGPAGAGELDIYEHNGSVIDWFVVGSDIQATYATPRPGLEAVGIKPGTVLFKGAYDGGERIIGKAFAFKPGCPPAGYDVIGTDKGKRIVLDGPAPRRDPKGCAVIGYFANSPHAHLVLNYSAHHH